MDRYGAQLDFQGVILLMWSATIPLVYYGFPCERELRWKYWKLLTGLAITCSLSTFHPRFRDPFLRPVRAGAFGSLALCTMLPIFHAVFKYGWHIQNQRTGISWVVITLALNVTGAASYAFKVHRKHDQNCNKESRFDEEQIPERWFRRRFDIWGASHQIFHVMVVLAALTYTRGLLEAFDFAHDHDESCKR
jgi:adiponectin receptor